MSILLYLIAASLGADVIYGFYLIGRPRDTVTHGKAFTLLVLNAAMITILVIAAGRLS